MAISEGLAAAKLAFEIGKTVADKLKNPTVDHQAIIASVMTMQDHVLSAQAALNDAREENDALRRQLAERDAHQALDDDLDFVQDGGFWIRRSERDKGWNNPLCPVCWGDTQKVVPMKRLSAGGYMCVKHNAIYETSESILEEARRTRQSMEGMGRNDGGTPWG